ENLANLGRNCSSATHSSIWLAPIANVACAITSRNTSHRQIRPLPRPITERSSAAFVCVLHYYRLNRRSPQPRCRAIASSSSFLVSPALGLSLCVVAQMPPRVHIVDSTSTASAYPPSNNRLAVW